MSHCYCCSHEACRGANFRDFAPSGPRTRNNDISLGSPLFLSISFDLDSRFRREGHNTIFDANRQIYKIGPSQPPNRPNTNYARRKGARGKRSVVGGSGMVPGGHGMCFRWVVAGLVRRSWSTPSPLGPGCTLQCCYPHC